MRNKLLLLSFILALCLPAAAQTIPKKHFTVNEGLPSNMVYSVIREKNGYLWFATDKGIARYNGREFEVFTTHDGMPDNEVFNMREDFEGRLWLSTFNGGACFYKDNTFYSVKNTPWLKLPFKSAQLTALLTPDSAINLFYDDPTKLVRIKGKQLRAIRLPDSKSGVGNIEIVPNVGYRLVYPFYYLIVDTSGKLIEKHLLDKRYTVCQPLNMDGAPRYATAEDGIYDNHFRKVFGFKKVKVDISPQSNINIAYNDVLVSSINDLVINDSIKIPLGQFITTIERDKNGNIWVSTRGKGAYWFSRHFKSMLEYKQVYNEQVIFAKHVGNSLFYINNTGQLYELKDKRSTPLLQLKWNKRKVPKLIPSLFQITPNGSFFYFVENESMVIPALSDRPLRKFDISLQTGSKEILYNGKNIFMSMSIGDIYKYAYKELIAGNKIPNEQLIINPDTFRSDGRIYSRAINPADSILWFSGKNYIYKVNDTIAEQQPQFGSTCFRQFSFFNKYLVGITENNQLVLYNNFSGKNIAMNSVASNDCIWETIYPIDDHRAIISTNNYYRMLTLYPASGKPKYSIQVVEDPFIPRQAEYLVADTDNIYFFKEGTITQIATSVFFEKTPLPTPIFSSFKTRNQTYPIRSKITIPYSESRNINISFDNQSFSAKDVTCQYSITKNGKDEWLNITGNEINLNTPGFGNYTIKIRSKTLGSAYSRPAVLNLSILKPFWATWWFITICAILFLLLIWGIIQFVTWRKLRKKQKQHEADMKYQQSEYRALNALMNPHFIFNSLNNIQGLINKDEKLVANEYLVIFSDLIRQNMHNISKGFISLEEELNLVENYLNLEKLRFKEFIQYSITVEDYVETEDIMIPPLMIQPLVENAVKHGLLPKQSTDNKVDIYVYEKGNTLYIDITDNGVGITYSQKQETRLHESFGLSNLQKRTEHLRRIQKQQIDIEIKELVSDDGTVLGTKATVKMALEEE